MYTRYKTHPGHIVQLIMKERKLSLNDVVTITGLCIEDVESLYRCKWFWMSDNSSKRLAKLEGTPEYWQEIWKTWHFHNTTYWKKHKIGAIAYYPL